MFITQIFRQDYLYSLFQQQIPYLIDCGMSATHRALGHVQFPADRYMRRISIGNTRHSEIQARTILLGNNEPYRIWTGNSNYTFGHDRCSHWAIFFLGLWDLGDHPSPPSAKGMNKWSYTSNTPQAFMGYVRKTLLSALFC
jgi:hypothetical protein